MAKPTVFIDGEAGTTGLQIADRLRVRDDLTLLSIPDADRKDPAARRGLMADADAVILCLPDDAARQAVTLAEGVDAVIIDASTAHRTAPGWTYGFPEMSDGQRAAIAASERISNPGCYPTGFIAIVRPLVHAALVPADYPVTVNAVSGYSGGGKAMIAEFETGGTDDVFRAYGLSQMHKHMPEMAHYTGLTRAPVFTPAVGRFAQGMLVEVPLALWSLPGRPDRRAIHQTLQATYEGEPFVSVASLERCDDIASIDPEALNGSNRMELFVFGIDEQVRIVARLDNLGKGASGAAVQSLNIVLGLDEAAGLNA